MRLLGIYMTHYYKVSTLVCRILACLIRLCIFNSCWCGATQVTQLAFPPSNDFFHKTRGTHGENIWGTRARLTTLVTYSHLKHPNLLRNGEADSCGGVRGKEAGEEAGRGTRRSLDGRYRTRLKIPNP